MFITVLVIILVVMLLAGLVVSVWGNKNQSPEGKNWFFEQFSGEPE